MVISTDTEEAVDKIQTPLKPFKNTQQTRNRKKYFNIIKAIYENRTTNIILHSERLKTFLVRQDVHLYHFCST